MAHIPIHPPRPFVTTDVFLPLNKEQTFMDEHGVRSQYNKLDPVTRSLRPFIAPTKRGRIADYGIAANDVHRALGPEKTGRKFSKIGGRYEKLQYQHELATELRYNGETSRARYLRWIIRSFN